LGKEKETMSMQPLAVLSRWQEATLTKGFALCKFA